MDNYIPGAQELHTVDLDIFARKKISLVNFSRSLIFVARLKQLNLV